MSVLNLTVNLRLRCTDISVLKLVWTDICMYCNMSGGYLSYFIYGFQYHLLVLIKGTGSSAFSKYGDNDYRHRVVCSPDICKPLTTNKHKQTAL